MRARASTRVDRRVVKYRGAGGESAGAAGVTDLRVGRHLRRVMYVAPSDSRGPRDPHARDFAAWERQLAHERGRSPFLTYAAVYGVVLVCGVALILLHDSTLGIAVLVIAAVVGVLWFSER